MQKFDPNLYREKYRIKSNRISGYNYSAQGHYFITICTKNMVEHFGRIVNGQMVLNKYGKIVQQNLLNINGYFDNVGLDEYIVMPNHVHVIIEIICKATDITDAKVEIIHELSLRRRMIIPMIVGKYKMQTSKQIHYIGLHNFAWQLNYYDHIIRNEKSLNNIREYIKNNPKNWISDRNNI
jgi:REP-associated tyrosine transposase